VIIYHIALVPEWQEAVAHGSYLTSTRGRTLADEGFLHASAAHQVAPVANLFYSDLDEADLTVLVIDVDRLGPEVRFEAVPGWDDPLPHIYGPMNTDAVVGTLPLTRDADGRFTFSPS
jgi:uncharacterized protein (DUF952 family)